MSDTVTWRPKKGGVSIAEVKRMAKATGKTVNRFIDDAVEELLVIKGLQAGMFPTMMKVCRAMMREEMR